MAHSNLIILWFLKLPMTDTPLPDSAATPSDHSSIFGPRHVTRLMIAIVAVICCVIFSYGARIVNWPAERWFQGSLAQAPMAMGAFLMAIVLLILCTGLGTLVLSRRFFLAGLMTATAGLTTWAVRGGSMSYVLFNANNTGANGRIFLQLTGEVIVLFAVIGGIWNVLWTHFSIVSSGPRRAVNAMPSGSDSPLKKTVLIHLLGAFGYVWLARRNDPDSVPEHVNEKERSTLAAVVAQSALMIVFVLILVATPQKKQVLAGIFIASLCSTAIAEVFFASRSAARWYWVGPLVAAIFGYIANYISPVGLETGDMRGSFGALARVLPLDYASLGAAGALMGYWWMMPEEQEELAPVSEPAP